MGTPLPSSPAICCINNVRTSDFGGHSDQGTDHRSNVSISPAIFDSLSATFSGWLAATVAFCGCVLSCVASHRCMDTDCPTLS